MKTLHPKLIPFFLLLALAVWRCNFSNQPAAENLLTVKLDDSLSTYDSIRIDILYPNGTVYKDSIFYGKYAPAADHQLKDLDLGANPPANYQILITGIRAGNKVLVFSIPVTPKGAEPPKILVREPPRDTVKTPVDTVPRRVNLITPSPLILAATAQATALKAEVQPRAANQALLYSGFDTAVATLDAAGNIRPIRAGETDITVRSQGDTSLTALLHLKIIEPVDVKGVTLTPDKLTLYLGGDAYKLNAQTSPPDAKVSVIFQSDNDTVAKVAADGTVQPGKAGQASIRVFPAGFPSLFLTCQVTVEIDPPVLDAGSDRDVRPKEIVTFPLTVTQKNGGVAALKWDLDGDNVWDDSVKIPTASPQHVYDGKDSLITVHFYVRDTEGNFINVSRKVHVGQTLAAPVFTSATTPSPTRLAKPAWAWTGNPGGTGAFRYVFDGKPEAETRATTFIPDSLPDGEHTLVVRELDASGRLSDSATRTIKVVTLGPIVTITSPNGGFLTNAAVVGVAWTVKQASGAILSNSNSEKLAGKQGAVKIIREESDIYGNRGADTVTIFRDTIAPEPPSFTAQTSPVSVNAANTSPVQWAWTRAAPNDYFMVSLNGAPAVKQASTAYTLPNAANGTYILNVLESDSAGNLSTGASYSIFVDRTAPPTPSVSGTTPTGNPTWSWTPGAGSDGAKIYRYKLSTAAAYSTETNSTSYSPSGLATGSYTLQVQERDGSGNWSGDGTWKIDVDKTGPVVTVGKPTPFGRVTSVNPVVSGSVMDENGIRKVEYKINTGTYAPVTPTGSNWTFLDNYDAGVNTIWIRGEDQFGNKDSASIKIYKYPNVVFVRKNATGTGKSWEDAYGEMYDALDSTKVYPVGTNIWVTKGSYGGSPSRQNDLPIYHSDIHVLGGFFDDHPSVDSTQRDISLGVSTISKVLWIGEPGTLIHDFILDGFTLSDRLWIANADHYRNSFRNLKFSKITSTTNILLTRGGNIFENCEFSDLLSTEDSPIYLKGTNEFRKCRFENVKAGAGNTAISFSGMIIVRDSYFSNNGGPDGGYHFNLSSNAQTLDIDGSQIQSGKAGILVDPSFPIGQFIYGNGNTGF